jgi:hypothetical protein
MIYDIKTEKERQRGKGRHREGPKEIERDRMRHKYII